MKTNIVTCPNCDTKHENHEPCPGCNETSSTQTLTPAAMACAQKIAALIRAQSDYGPPGWMVEDIARLIDAETRLPELVELRNASLELSDCFGWVTIAHSDEKFNLARKRFGLALAAVEALSPAAKPE